jgi:predicted MPP superfamily phosphohydrolase
LPPAFWPSRAGRSLRIQDDPRLISIEIPLARLPTVWNGLTIVQLSDFHYDDHFSAVPIRMAIA